MEETPESAGRRSERKRVRMAIILFVESEDGSAGHEAFTIDLSEMGARVESGVTLSPGQVIAVTPGEGAEPVPGRVVWVGQPASDMAGQAGLEYLTPVSANV